MKKLSLTLLNVPLLSFTLAHGQYSNHSFNINGKVSPSENPCKIFATNLDLGIIIIDRDTPIKAGSITRWQEGNITLRGCTVPPVSENSAYTSTLQLKILPGKSLSPNSQYWYTGVEHIGVQLQIAGDTINPEETSYLPEYSLPTNPSGDYIYPMRARLIRDTPEAISGGKFSIPINFVATYK